MDKLPLPERGKYVINVYYQDKNTPVDTFFFKADYPPQRIFAEGEIESILHDPNAVKGSQIEIECSTCGRKYKLELNLDHRKSISEGFTAFPRDNRIECCEGQPLDLTGMRRQIEWAFGQKMM